MAPASMPVQSCSPFYGHTREWNAGPSRHRRRHRRPRKDAGRRLRSWKTADESALRPCVPKVDTAIIRRGSEKNSLEFEGQRITHVSLGESENDSIRRHCFTKTFTSARSWLIAGIENLTCEQTENLVMLRDMFAAWNQAPMQTSSVLWNPRVGCLMKETYPALSDNMSISSDAPMVDSIPLPSFRGMRRVRFDPSACTVHEITPYGEIYGEHPRAFVFDRWSRKIPAAPCGFVSLQSWLWDYEEDDDISHEFHIGLEH